MLTEYKTKDCGILLKCVQHIKADFIGSSKHSLSGLFKKTFLLTSDEQQVIQNIFKQRQVWKININIE